MLAFPTHGFSHPTVIPPEVIHNVELDILCDWIEGSVLFDQEGISTTDVIDVLIEEGVYESRDLASNIVSRAWNELKRRLRWIGSGSPFIFRRRKIQTIYSWKENPAYSFCVLLSMSKCYDYWSTKLDTGGYGKQGQLFESLTKASMENQFLDWEVYQTGWSASNPVKLSGVVNEISKRLGEEQGNIKPWENPDGNDAGLDLFCYRPFPDGRVGIPVYLVQCASGKNWFRKLHEPELSVWTKMILFAATPKKAFAIPFALLDDEFKERCNKVDGMLLDRYRLLAASTYNKDWVSDDLNAEIIDWVTPRMQTLPRYNK